MVAKKPKILIIEDESELAELFSLKLQEVGFVVEIAFESQVGLAKLKKDCPDLILLDLVMPDIDGYEILRKIKKGKLCDKAIVLVWSNLTQEDEIDKANKLGADGYLIKSDYTPTKLAEKVKEVLGR